MTAEELDAIRKRADAAMKVAPGAWECDDIDNDDGHGKFKSYAVYLSDGRLICDTLNSSIIEIEQEADEYGVMAFDHIGAACMEFVAVANPVAVLALLSALEDANRRADDAEARNRFYTERHAQMVDDVLVSKAAQAECTALRARVAELDAALNLRRCEYRYVGLDGKTTTAAALEDERDTLRARVAELEAGGCARDQGTTQYCAEAVALQKRVAELERIAAFFASCIKSGESWSETCESKLAVAALKKEPRK